MSKVMEIGSGRRVGTPDSDCLDLRSILRSLGHLSCKDFFLRLLVLLGDLVGDAGALSVSNAIVERSDVKIMSGAVRKLRRRKTKKEEMEKQRRELCTCYRNHIMDVLIVNNI